MNDNSGGRSSTNSEDIDEFSKSVQQLGSRYIKEYARNVKRYAEFVDSLSQRGSDRNAPLTRDTELESRYAEFVLHETPVILGRIAEAGLSYYSTLADESMHAINRYYDRVLQPADLKTPRASTTKPQSETSTVLVFHGMRGESANNAFLVTNHRDEPIEVAFEMSDIVSHDGGTRVNPIATFTPHRYTLASQQNKVIQCAIMLSEDYAQGQIHSGSILVTGFPEMSMRINIQVEEPARHSVSAPSIQTHPERKKPARKKVSKKVASKKKVSSKKRASAR